MEDPHAKQESHALQTLLAIDDPFYQPRYDHNSETSLKKTHKTMLFQRTGKENIICKKDVLPKVNSSKQELKMILKRLEGGDGLREEPQPLRSKKKVWNNNSSYSQTCGLKNLKQDKQVQSLANGTYKKQGSKGVLDIGAGDDIRTLMRQKNYSTNALNLKTLHILQQLNCKNSRAYSLSVKNNDCKNPNKRNMIAFLRRVA